MEEVKSKLHYLKTKILQYSEIPDNIRLELSNDIFKVEQALTIHSVVVPKGTLKTKPKRTLGDFDVWYKPCTRCGYDTAKSTKPKDGNKTCWKCGNFVQRDYTDRALKK